MRVYRFVILLGVVVGLVTLASQALHATPPRSGIPKCFDYTLEPKSLPDNGGPVELDFTFTMKPEYECDSVKVQVGVWKRLVYDGPKEFWVSLAETGEYSTTLSVTVAPNDTSVLFMNLSCQGCSQDFAKTFITTGDAMEVFDYVPTPRSMVKRSASRYLVRSGSWKNPFSYKGKVTEEQLRTIDTVAIGLNDPDDFAFAESLLGPIPDSALITGTRGAYLLEMTLDNLFRMGERGIRYDRTPEYTELEFSKD